MKPHILAAAALSLLPSVLSATSRPFYRTYNRNHEDYYKVPQPAGLGGSSSAGASGRFSSKEASASGGGESAGLKASGGFRLQVPEVGAGREAKDGEGAVRPRQAGARPRPEPFEAGDAAAGGGAPGGVAGPDEAQVQTARLSAPEDPAAASWEAAQRRFAGLMRSGDRQLLMGDAEGALASAEDAIRAQPALPGGYLIKATALGLLSRHVEGERAALQAVERGADAEAWEQLAWAQLNLGKTRDAVRNARKAIELDPRSATAFAIMAFAQERLGSKDEMLAQLQKAAELDPARYEERLKLARSSVPLFDPGSGDSWALLGALTDAPAPLPPAAPFPWPGALAAGAAAAAGAAGLLWKRRSRARERRGSVPGGEGLLGGKYRLEPPVGGGPAKAWPARDAVLERDVFIKRAEAAGKPGEDAYADCLLRARRLGELQHPNIVDIFEILDLDSGLHLVFERLEGKTVRQLLDERRCLPLPQAVQLLRPACVALEFASKRGIRHGNLKASNLMLTKTRYVKVLDFGLREVEAAEDIRALGVLLYAMAAGEAPFDASDAYVPAVTRVDGLGPRLDEIVRKALDPDPARGFRSVQWFAEAMELLA